MPGQKFGPAVYPGLIACGLLVCAVLLLARGWKARRQAALIEPMAWWRDRDLVVGFWLIVAVLAAYTAVSEAIGFIPVAIVALLALNLAFRVRPPVALAVAVLGTLLVHTIFYKGLRVPLPWGVLKSLAW